MKHPILLVLFSCLGLGLFAQEGVVIDAAEPEAEFHVAINPLDSNHIIVATMHGKGTVPGGSDIRIYYTFDQGITWETSAFQGVYEGYDQAADPVLAFDAVGDVYLVNLSLAGGYRTVLSKSTDGGATWEMGTDVFLIPTDKPWLAIDRFENSPYKDNIYVPVVNYFAGPTLLTFDPNFNQTGETLAGPLNEHLPGVAIRKDGQVFMSMVDTGNPNQVFVAQFTNGGQDIVHKTLVTTFPRYNFNSPTISNTFQHCVSIAIDNSGGPFDGRIYVTYTASEANNPSIFDVYISYSDDSGLSWSDPVSVITDAPAATQQFYSSLFVNDQGVLMLDWYDRRNYPTGDLNTDFFLGISYDGGQTFINIQLNSQSMDFQYTVASGDGFGLGEYHSMVATDHTALAFWADGRTNDEDLNIYMAKVHLGSTVTSVQELGPIYTGISISSPYPIPALEEIYLDLQIDKSAQMQVLLLDMQGRILNTTNWRDYAPGNYTERLTLPSSAGTYIVQVQSENGFFKSFKVTKQ